MDADIYKMFKERVDSFDGLLQDYKTATDNLSNSLSELKKLDKEIYYDVCESISNFSSLMTFMKEEDNKCINVLNYKCNYHRYSKYGIIVAYVLTLICVCIFI